MPPRLGADGGYEDDEESDHDLLDESRRRASRILHGFIDFAFQGNVLEIAFGLIIASMFTALITSLVSDILLPPISVLLPLNKNLEEKFAVLRAGPHRPEDSGYNTLKQAQDDGAVVMAYGWVFFRLYLAVIGVVLTRDSFFLNRLINFMGVGFSLYGLAALYQYFSEDPIIKHTIKCRYCRKRINEKVSGCACHGEWVWANLTQSTRCVNCTSWQDGREDRHFG